MKPAYLGQCPCGINIDINIYPAETEIDTNPSLTLPRIVTLSTGEHGFGNFTSSLVRDQESKSEIHVRRKITIARN